MRVGIDASRLRPGMSGIGRYVSNILGPLDAALPEAAFFLYTRAPLQLSLPSDRWRVRCDTHWAFSHLPTVAWIHFRLGLLACRDELDVFWAANTLVPAGMGELPCVTTLYDLNHLLFPQTMSLLTRLAHRRWLAGDVLAAARMVAISEGTSARSGKHLGRCADAIARPAIPLKIPLPEQDQSLEQLGKFGICPPYLLTVGTREPRKNLDSVVSAVETLKSAGLLPRHQLVMVGALGWGGGFKAARPAARSAYKWIRPLGYVDDAALAALYSMADAFIFPSLYEGYGIPVGEALAFGCRVIASDLPELREVGGGDVVYVAPSPAGIAHGLTAALANPPPIPRNPLHDWTDAASTMAVMLRQAMQSLGESS